LLHELSATEAARLIRARQINSEELVRALLDRINGLDRQLFAWQLVNADAALAAARAADVVAARRTVRLGRLHGVPYGAKDVIDTAGLRTTAGFRPFRNRVPLRSARVIELMHRAGAILLGKTVTTQFAYSDPSRSRNPWSKLHSPGGSSSGSATAVSARQVPIALGTQTGGSLLRPAAFTGVVAFKPSFGAISTQGVIPLSWTLDHVGIIARSINDCLLVSSPWLERTVGASTLRAPRLGLVTSALKISAPEIVDSFSDAVANLRREGASVIEIKLGHEWAELQSVHRTIMQCEASAVHWHMADRAGNGYLPRVKSFILAGRYIPAPVYVHALRLRNRIRESIARSLIAVDAMILPTVAAPPPGLESTGDSSLQSPFTLGGFPTCTLPYGLLERRLPLGLQLVGQLNGDRRLLGVALWCEQYLDTLPAPPGC
jgi:aspartyl-tRNA(Asn)/glutamyl-tRNA(Gln) amidotransferase subunit A